MKNIPSNPTPIFGDRHFNQARNPPRLAAQEPGDLAEVVMRVLLVLCIIVSPFLCGLRAPTAQTASAGTAASENAAAFAQGRAEATPHFSFSHASLRMP